MKNLLILESPNKVKKVQGYVGSNYLVSASKGHIRNLGTQKVLGIDINNNFNPTYNIDPNKKNVVKMLKELLNKCDNTVYIATDFDREGEAIGWHVVEVLNVPHNNIKRLVFKEITKKGLETALKSPVKLDMNMVHSQQARMVLDKLIGYKVSPVLWKKFNNYKLSAGRVQSVVVKLINERESEITQFKSSNYYKLTVGFSLSNNDMKTVLETECESKLTDVNEVSNIINNTDDKLSKYYIIDLKKNKTKRNPSPPFTTSSLQQEASNKLGMSPDICMKTAQKLYEQGLITYMRTDSLALSDDALKSLAVTIKSKYGEKYYKYKLYNKKKSKNAQEAHEACRPTDLKKESVVGINGLSTRENKLYQLIWRRTMACQMAPADVEIKTIKVGLDSQNCNPKLNEKKYNNNKPYTFTGKFEKILFDGFLAVYNYKNKDDDNEDENESNKNVKNNLKKMEKLFASLKKEQEVWCNELDALEKETKCPNSRYTEASLVKKLEDLGIGRPSTYASMVTKVQTRGYVEKKTVSPKEKEFTHLSFKYPSDITVEKLMLKVGGEKNKLFPTSVGIMVTDFLVKDFSKFMDYGFTALVEEKLDEVAQGKIEWFKVLDNVWSYLYPIIDKLGQAIANNKKQNGGNNKNLLGINPNTNNNIYLISTRYGWSVMEEVSKTDKKSNKWASLPTNIKPEALTLEKSLTLFIYPKNLGTYKNKKLELHKAKNVYLKYNNKNYNLEQYNKFLEDDNKSLPNNKKKTIIEPENMTKTDCIEVIKFLDKYNQELNKKKNENITFQENSDVVIKNGPYGYYIKYMEHYNIPLPIKWKKNVSNITYSDCVDIIGKFINKRGLKVKLKEQLEELQKSK
jgi:DNA topoisomerase-1